MGHGPSNTILPKTFNSLPYDKILYWSRLKAFADDNLNVNQQLKFAFGRTENILGKGENAGYQHFHLFAQCFSEGSEQFLLFPQCFYLFGKFSTIVIKFEIVVCKHFQYGSS